MDSLFNLFHFTTLNSLFSLNLLLYNSNFLFLPFILFTIQFFSLTFPLSLPLFYFPPFFFPLLILSPSPLPSPTLFNLSFNLLYINPLFSPLSSISYLYLFNQSFLISTNSFKP